MTPVYSIMYIVYMADIYPSTCWNLYDPNWEQRFEQAQRADDLTAMQDTWVGQFRDAREYASHILKALEKSTLAQGGGWVAPDLSGLTTLEDANALYRAKTEEAESLRKQLCGRLREGGELFPKDSSYSMRVKIQYGDIRDQTSHTNVTVEDMGDKRRICMEGALGSGSSVVNNYEDAATIFYYNHLLPMGVLPQDTEWYLHIPVGLNFEKFSPVALAFGRNRFLNAQWGDNADVIPSAVKNPHFPDEGLQIMAPVRFVGRVAKLG